jgi:hypothetical protein
VVLQHADDLGGGCVGIPAAHPPDVLAGDTATPPDSLVDLALGVLVDELRLKRDVLGSMSPTCGGTVRVSSDMVHPPSPGGTLTAF